MTSVVSMSATVTFTGTGLSATQSYQRRGESVFQAARAHAVGEPAQVGNGIGEGDNGRLKIIVGALPRIERSLHGS